MNILLYLKRKKEKLIKKNEQTCNIEIIIENESDVFENEKENILENAKILLENKYVDTLLEGIITSATMFRGLQYKRTVKDENGNIKIILNDRVNHKLTLEKHE